MHPELHIGLVRSMNHEHLFVTVVRNTKLTNDVPQSNDVGNSLRAKPKWVLVSWQARLIGDHHGSTVTLQSQGRG